MATDQSGSPGLEVPSLKNKPFFSVERDDGYVRIEQSLGNQLRYTPEEARDIAQRILEAAEDAKQDE